MQNQELSMFEKECPHCNNPVNVITAKRLINMIFNPFYSPRYEHLSLKLFCKKCNKFSVFVYDKFSFLHIISLIISAIIICIPSYYILEHVDMNNVMIWFNQCLGVPKFHANIINTGISAIISIKLFSIFAGLRSHVNFKLVPYDPEKR